MRLYGLTKMSSFFALAGVKSYLWCSQGDPSDFMIPLFHGYVIIHNMS